METFQAQYDRYREMAEAALRRMFAQADPPQERPWQRLWDAMGYSVLAGGKRVRPVMALAVCEALGGRAEDALAPACALELVHTYSLIHDDLPCMDDDDLRRGRPTCHKVYGETLAVLAGDALQAEAFRLIACAPGLTGEQRAESVRILAEACGGDGMVAGQVLDVDQLAGNAQELRQLCALKTGALLRAAAELGCAAAGASRSSGGGPRTARSTSGWPSRSGTTCWMSSPTSRSSASPWDRTGRRASATFVDLLDLAAVSGWWRRRPGWPGRRRPRSRRRDFCWRWRMLWQDRDVTDAFRDCSPQTPSSTAGLLAWFLAQLIKVCWIWSCLGRLDVAPLSSPAAVCPPATPLWWWPATAPSGS